MPAHSPEEICQIFQRAMLAGDLDAVLSVYDREAVFVHESGEVTASRGDLQKALQPLVAARTRFDFTIKKIVETSGIALMHTLWTVSTEPPRKTHAIEVARKQADGTWKWLIGDPFTVGREPTS